MTQIANAKAEAAGISVAEYEATVKAMWDRHFVQVGTAILHRAGVPLPSAERSNERKFRDALYSTTALKTRRGI